MVEELQAADPQSIGPYRLLGRLGAGGMGQVFLGCSAGSRLVAIKIIRPELAGEPGFRARFAREVTAARNVGGLFTALVVDADVDVPMPWLATAYVAGPSLAEAVHAKGPLPVASVLTLAAGLAEGLAAIHAAGVVHRDLKPSNVLLADDGPRVIDFGISRAAETSMLTQSGTVMGSPGFMSPEQAEGGLVGPASDVFSLGAVLAFAAVGESPFGAGSTPALVYRVVHNEPDIVRVPDQLRPLVERCLAKDPGQRPTTADLLARLGSAEPAPNWLPAAMAEVLGGYRLPAADSAVGPPTVTAARSRRQPKASDSSAQGGGTGVRAPRRIRQRLALLPAGAALAAAAALVIVLGAHRDAVPTPHRPAAPASAHRHRAPLAMATDLPSASARRVSKPLAKSPSKPATATHGGAVGQGSPSSTSAKGPGSQPSPVSAPAPVQTTAAVPDVLYTTLSAATAALEARGFRNIPYLYDCYGSSDIDAVVSQSPAAGTSYGDSEPVSLKLQADNC